jgi:ubiquitin-conjugating enzyme E2 D/E
MPMKRSLARRNCGLNLKFQILNIKGEFLLPPASKTQFRDPATSTTMTPAKKRLEKEFHGLRKSAGVHEGYSVDLKNGEIFEWTGSIHGLENSPYEGGTFAFHIRFTDAYPEEPPKIHITTKIYHPNVNARTGAVSWKMIGEDWHHNDTVEKVLIGLRRLLVKPELESAVEVDVGNEYANQRDVFEKKARMWTAKTAHADST